jgi:hypothetical protein
VVGPDGVFPDFKEVTGEAKDARDVRYKRWKGAQEKAFEAALQAEEHGAEKLRMLGSAADEAEDEEEQEEDEEDEVDGVAVVKSTAEKMAEKAKEAWNEYKANGTPGGEAYNKAIALAMRVAASPAVFRDLPAALRTAALQELQGEDAVDEEVDEDQGAGACMASGGGASGGGAKKGRPRREATDWGAMGQVMYDQEKFKVRGRVKRLCDAVTRTQPSHLIHQMCLAEDLDGHKQRKKAYTMHALTALLDAVEEVLPRTGVSSEPNDWQKVEELYNGEITKATEEHAAGLQRTYKALYERWQAGPPATAVKPQSGAADWRPPPLEQRKIDLAERWAALLGKLDEGRGSRDLGLASASERSEQNGVCATLLFGAGVVDHGEPLIVRAQRLQQRAVYGVAHEDALDWARAALRLQR